MLLREYISKYGATVSEQTSKLRARNLENYISKFGKDAGTIKYLQYCEKQRVKNTFEHKSSKYGWTKEEFDAFNRSRAITKETMVKKYGKTIGIKKYNDYCEKQRTAGISEDYFVTKLGELEGKKKYLEVSKSKAHNLENYTRLYGNDAKNRLEDFYSSVLGMNNGTSKVQKKFEKELCDSLKKKGIKFVAKFGESPFATRDSVNDKNYVYDFVILHPIKICIEFNGDYWHMNPKKYSSENINKTTGLTAYETWKKDEAKLKHIANLGFTTAVVWEKDYSENHKKEVNQCVRLITALMNSQKL
jgi:G:T-mismatch repair DNA endonuclease (very short patch repair protein)